MEVSVRWKYASEKDENGNCPPITSVGYSPQGDYVVASCGARILIYSTATGTLVQNLKGHTDTVNCVEYSADGKRIASGSADKTVVVWTSKGDGIVKYQHSQSVQVVAHNPVSGELASISNVDWGLWSTEKSKVVKRSLPSKGLSAAWTADGQTLAIGLLNGTIIFLTNGVTEKCRVIRHAPIWTMSFGSDLQSASDILAVGSWDQRLSFYNVNGEVAGKERDLIFNPCSVSYYCKSQYLLVAGNDRKISLHMVDGCRLVSITTTQDWIWCSRQRPGSLEITCGTNDGLLSNFEVLLPHVYCTYHDQYIYREHLSDVVVHQLTLDRVMRIPCGEYVRAVATYRDRLAVLFEEILIVFELYYDEDRTMRYQDIAQIRKSFKFTMMATARHSVIIVNEKRISLYDYHGNKRREWSMDSNVTFIHVDGGSDERELVLVGLQSGQCMKLFIDNPFPIQILKISAAIHHMHFNCLRTKLAVVDESNNLTVFDIKNNCSVVFTEPDVNIALFEANSPDIIAYTTTTGLLNVKTESLPPFQQPCKGVLLSIECGQMFLLSGKKVISVDVPHSHALYRYIGMKDFDAAYRIASMGVTYGDWMMVGLQAMTNLRLDIARKAFTRIHDVRFVELLNALELSHRQSGAEKLSENGVLLGDIMAFQGKYGEASRQYLKCSREDKAIEMYADLKMWHEARKVCSNEEHLKELIRQQARWAEDSQNFVEAASLYENCGELSKAVLMLGRSGDMDRLIKMCRGLPKSEVELISKCAVIFKEKEMVDYAIEAYEKINDCRSLIQAYVEQGSWKRAFSIIEKSPQYARDVYVPWANWLAENDKFEEALEAFRAAKWPQEAIRMMETMVSNNVTCRRFGTAAFYLVHLASEYGQFEDGEQPTNAMYAHRIKMSHECIRRANIYYAYSIIYTHTTQPFPFDDLALFRASKYLLAMCSEGSIPVNVGKAEILYTLARAANRLGMTRTARNVYDKLQTIILPQTIMEQVDVETLIVRSKNLDDKDELLDICYRCKQKVPLLTLPGDRCPQCFHPFVRSFITFEVLPLVEFTLANELQDEEAANIITSRLSTTRIAADDEDELDKVPDTAAEASAQANVITFEEQNIDYQIDQQLNAMGRSKAAANKGGDPFFTQLQFVTRPGRANGVYHPFVANADMLHMFKREEIIIIRPPYGTLPVPNRYYRLVDTEAQISVCSGCQHFFNASDLEYETMKGNGCPICRHKPGVEISRSLKEIMLAMETPSQK